MLKRLGFVAGFVWCFVLGFSSWALAAEQIPEIRVQLQVNTNQAVVTATKGNFDVVNGGTGICLGTLNEGGSCVINKEGLNMRLAGFSSRDNSTQKGVVYFKPVDNKHSLLSFNNVQYRGSITVNNTDNGLTVVNSLPVEKYLYGVVGQEMGYGAPLEALKSQAIISRSYAMGRIGSGLYFDLTNSAQVYKGYSAELVSGFSKVKEAVDATIGEVVCYHDEIIDAVFHSNSGGYTESSENIWQASVPYLRAVASPYDEHAFRYSYQDASGWPGNSYKWTVSLNNEQLNQCIGNWNASYPNDAINIGQIKDIKISRIDNSTGKKTESGRVTAIALVGSLGEKVITKDNIRSFFKVDGRILKSTLFDLSFDSGASIVSASGITINGKGNGHGIGLSQWGARGMAAEQGMDCKEIIKHYYSNVKLKEIY